MDKKLDPRPLHEGDNTPAGARDGNSPVAPSKKPTKKKPASSIGASVSGSEAGQELSAEQKVKTPRPKKRLHDERSEKDLAEQSLDDSQQKQAQSETDQPSASLWTVWQRDESVAYSLSGSGYDALSTEGAITRAPGAVSPALSQASVILNAFAASTSPTLITKDISVTDGYIGGAHVYLDLNSDGQVDAGDKWIGDTGPDGSFTANLTSAELAYALLGQGGTDISTGLPFQGILKAPAGSTVLNPLTTLVQEIIESTGVDVATAEQMVIEALALPASVTSLSDLDFLHIAVEGGSVGGVTQADAIALQAIAVQVANLISVGAAVIENAAPAALGGGLVLQSLADAIVVGANANQAVDLTNGVTLGNVLADAILNSGAPVDATTQSKVPVTLALVNQAVEDFASAAVTAANTGGSVVVPISELVQAQIVAQDYLVTLIQDNGGFDAADAASLDTINEVTLVSSTVDVAGLQLTGTVDAQVATPPALVAINSMVITSTAGADNTYKAGDLVTLTMTMTETVNVTGTPQLTLNIGGASRAASYVSGSGSSSLIFGYTIQAGDNDVDGISIAVNSLSLNGGTIRNIANADAVLTHTAVEASHSHQVDTAVPSAPTIGMVAGDDIINASETGSAITGTAQANATVTLTLGSGNTHTVTADGSGNWSYTLQAADITAMGQGGETISATATDVAGNTSIAGSRSITSDTIISAVPAVALTVDTGSSNSDSITSIGTLTVSGAEAGATVDYSSDGSTWTSSFTPAEGSNTVYVRQTDVAGNVSVASAPYTFTLDTAIPSAPGVILSNDTGVSASDKITNNGALTVSGAEAGATVEYSSDGTTWTNNFTPVAGGNSVYVRQTDVAGNVSVSSAAYSFTLDTAIPSAPSVALTTDTGASASDKITSNGALTVSGAEAGATVEYSSDGTTWGSSFTPVAGSNTVYVRQTDVAGNVSTASAAYSFTLDSSAAAPSVALSNDTGASNGDRITRDGTLTVSGAEAGATVDYSADGTTWTSSFTPVQGSNSVYVRQTDVAGNVSTASAAYSFTLDSSAAAPSVALSSDTGASASDKITSNGALTVSGAEASATVDYSSDGTTWISSFTPAEGSNSVYVRQTDVAGNVSVASAPYTFTLDTAIPSAPSVALTTDTGASNSDKFTSNGALTVSGSEAGAMVEYSSDGTTWVSSFTPVPGSNSVYVRQTDVAGNVSVASAPYTFTLDTAIPSAPGVILSNDTGVSNSDRITSNGTLSVSGAEAGATVDYSSDGTMWGSSFTPVAGGNSVYVRQTDVAGNVSVASAPYTFTLDTAIPSAPGVILSNDTGVSNSDRITSNGTLTVSGAEAGATVDYSSDGTTWTSSFTPAEGSNTVYVRQTDVAGNVSSASAAYSFTLDTAVPSAPTLVLSTDTGSSNSDAVTSNGALTVSGTEAGATVEYSSDGTTWGSSVTPVAGSNTVYVRQTDVAGNVSSASAAYSFTLDNAAPSAPAIATVAGNDIINASEASGTITGTAEANATLTLTLGSGNVRTVTADSAGAWTYTLQAADIAAMGQYGETISAAQTDVAGNAGPAATRTISIDTVAPSMPTIATVAGNDVISSAEANSAISGTAEANATVTLTLGSGNTRTVTANGSGNWAYTLVAADITAMGEGAETITATATDAAGNTSTAASRAISINTTTVLAPPTIATVAGNDTLNANETSAVVSGTAVANATVTLTLGSGNTRAVTADGSGNWSYTLQTADITAMGQGAETISGTQTDADGNVSAAATRTISIDTALPSVPTIGLVAGNDVINASETASAITGTAEVNATVTLTLGSGNTRTVTADGSGNWSYNLIAADLTAMGQGAEIIEATATDASGNVSGTNTRNISIDTVVPSAPAFGAVATDNTINASETASAISGTADANSTVSLTLGNGNTRIVAANGSGIWTYTLVAADITAMGQGSETLTAVSSDTAGNTSSASHGITVDTVAPTVTITDSTSGAATGDILYTFTFSEPVTGFTDAGVTLSAGATKGSFTAVSASEYTLVVTPPASSAGTLTVDVAAGVAQDGAGNANTAAVQSSQPYDTTPQALPTIDTVAGNDVINASEAGGTISGTALASSTVKLTLGTVNVHTLTADGSGIWSYTVQAADIAAMGQGSELITATDGSDNLGSLGSRTITIDTLAPSVPGVALGSDTGSSTTDKITKTGTLTVSGTESGATVQYSADGSNWASSFTPVEGANTVYVRQTDVAGNVSNASAAYSFMLDTAVPSAPTLVLSSDTGASNSDKITSNGALFLSGAEAGATVQYSSDGSTWTGSFTPVEGSNTVYVRQTDVAGNVSTTSAAYTFTLDTVNPSTPTVHARLTNDTTPTLTGTASVAGGETLSVTVNGKTYTVGDGNLSLTGSNWSLTLPGADALTQGTYAVTARITDAAGNTTADTTSNELVLDTTAPVLAITSAALTNDTTPVISGTAEAGVTVQISVAGATYTRIAAGGAWSVDTATATPSSGTLALNTSGNNAVSVNAVDTAGNVTMVAQTLVIDTAAPSPLLTVDNVTPDNALYADELAGNITITGSVGGDAAVTDTVSLILNGVTYTSNTSGAGRTFSIVIPGSAFAADSDQTIDASVVSTDNLGNTSAPVTITKSYVIAPVPTITLGSVTADNVLNAGEAGSTITVTGSVGGDAAVGDTVTLTINNQTYTGTADGSRNFSIAVPGAALLADGDKTIAASVSHTVSGVTGTGTATQSYTTDTSAPTPTITLNSVTADNIVNANEAGGNVTLSGSVGGDALAGNTVTLTINGVDYTGTVAADKSFSIANISGSGLVADADNTIAASVATTDAAGNIGTGTTNQIYTVDTAPPAIASASIAGNTLVLSFAETGSGFAGTTPAASAFAVVINGGGAVAPSSVSVNAIAKTVTLTLGSAVSGGDTVTVAYTQPGSNPLQDAAGNTTASFSGQAVTNNTGAPTTTATITGVTDNDAPTTGTVANNGSTDDTTPRLTGTVSTGLVGGEVVAIYRNGSKIGEATVAGTSWTYDDSGLTNGAYSYTAQVESGALSGPASSARVINVDATGPTIDAIAMTSSAGADNVYGIGDPVEITVSMSEATIVTGTPQLTLNVGGISRTASYVGGSGTNALVFSYAVQSGDTDTDGVSVAAGSLSLNGGTLRDAVGNDAALTHTGMAASASHRVDASLPTIDSVAITSNAGADSTYTPGDVVSVAVTFSEPITVSGTPFVTLDVGGLSRSALYASGTGGNTLVFNYTVQAGDTDTDGISLAANSLQLGTGGVLADAVGNNAVLTHGAVGASASHTVDSTVPTVNSLAISSNAGGDGTYQVGDTVSITVTMSEATTVDTTGGTPLLGLNIGGQTRTASYAGGSGSTALVFNYTVQAGDSDLDGLSIDANSMNPNGGAFTDAAGNSAVLTHAAVASSASHQVDGIAPAVQGIAISSSAGADAYYKTGDVVSVTVSLSEATTVNTTGGTPTLALEVGGVSRSATYAGGSGSNALVFTYTVQAGDTDSDGISIGANSLSLNGGTLKDATGNDAAIIHGALVASSSHLVDGIAPILSASNPLVPADSTTTPDNTFMGPSDNFLIRFTESLQKGSGNIRIVNDTDGATTIIAVSDAAITVSGNTVTINPASDLALGKSYHIEIDAGAFTDLAGNPYAGISGSTAWNFTVPDPAISLDPIATDNIINAVENGSLIALGGTVSSTTPVVLTTINASHISITLTPLGGGTTVTGTVTGYNAVTGAWTGTIPANTLVDGKTYAVAIDLNNGLGVAASTVSSTVVDTSGPTVSSVVVGSSPGVDNSYTAGDAVSVTLNMSEATTVTGSPQLDLNIGGTSRTATYAGGSGTNALTFTYTVQAGDNDIDGISIGAGSVNLNGGTLTDAAGNGATLSHGGMAPAATHLVDTAAPTVLISDSAGQTLKAGETTTLAFDFSEDVTGFSADDISVTNASKGTFTTISPRQYTLIVTPTANSGGTITVDVAGGAAQDAAGNASTAATPFTRAFDTVAPTLVINSDIAAGTTLSPGSVMTLTFAFSESVTGFTVDDVVLVNGDKGVFTQVDGSTYTLVVTPPQAYIDNEALTVDVAAGAALDAAGNASAAAVQLARNVDTKSPDLTITSDRSTLVLAGDVVTFTFAFDEDVTGFTTGDIQVANGTKGAFTAVNAREYTLVVTPAAGVSGEIALNVGAGAALDAAGNSNEAVSATQAIDTQRPTVTNIAITSNAGADNTYRTSDLVSLAVTFDDVVTVIGTPIIKLMVGGIQKNAFYAGGSGTNTLSFNYTVASGDTDADGIDVVLNTLATNGGTIRDGSGNNATLTHASLIGGATQTVDTSALSVTITDNIPGTLKAGQIATFTFGFSSGVTGFTIDDINVIGGTKGTFRLVNSQVYTLDVTPTAATVGTIEVSVPAGVVTNNPSNIASLTATQAYDTAAPTLVISDDAAGTLNPGAPVTFTFSFADPVSGFDATDVTVAGGVKGTFTATDLQTYTLVVTPDAGTSSVAASVAANSVQFASGNGFATAASASQPYIADNVGPSVTALALTSDAGTDNIYRTGDTVSITATMDENTFVTGTPTLTLNVGGVTRTATYASGSGTNALVFTYVIQGVDADTNGISIDLGSLSLNGGTFKDAVGNNAALAYAAVADAASHQVNVPTTVTLTPVLASLLETTSTATRVKVADIATTGDATGGLTVSGESSSQFEIVGSGLYLKAGAWLNYAADSQLTVSVNAAGSGGTASAAYSLGLGNFDPFALSIGHDLVTPIEAKTAFYQGISAYQLGTTGNYYTGTTQYTTVSNIASGATTVLENSTGGLIGLSSYGEYGRVATLARKAMLTTGLQNDPSTNVVARGMFNLFEWLSGEERTIGQGEKLNVLSTADTVASTTIDLNANQSMFMESFYQYMPADTLPEDRIREALTKDGAWNLNYDVVILRTNATQPEVDIVKAWMTATGGGVLFVSDTTYTPSTPVTVFLGEVGLALKASTTVFLAGNYMPAAVDPLSAAVVYPQLTGKDSDLGQAANNAIFSSTDIPLPREVMGGSVTWTSSDTSHITHDGHVVGSGAATMTAHVTFVNGVTQDYSVYFSAAPLTANTGLMLRILDNSTTATAATAATSIDSFLTAEMFAQAPLGGVNNTVTSLEWLKSAATVPDTAENSSTTMVNSLWAYAGYLMPTVSGSYQFLTKADDSAKFFIEANGQILSKAVTYSTTDANATFTVTLEAGKAYRIWAFMKPGSTSLNSSVDSMSVKWKLPGDTAFTVIPGTAFATLPDGMVPANGGWPEIYLPFTLTTPPAGPLTPTDIISQTALNDLLGNAAPVAANSYINFREEDLRFTPENLILTDALAARAKTLYIKLTGTGAFTIAGAPLPTVANGAELAAAIQDIVNAKLTTDATITVSYANNRLVFSDAGGRTVSNLALGTTAAITPTVYYNATPTVQTAGNESTGADTIVNVPFASANAINVTRVSLAIDSATNTKDLVITDLQLGRSTDLSTLATAINTAINPFDFNVTVVASGGNLVFTDGLGRVFTNISVYTTPLNDSLISLENTSSSKVGTVTTSTLGVLSGQVQASDANGDALTYSIVEAPKFGTVTLDAATGKYFYQPTDAANFHGYDQFHVQVSDGLGGFSKPVAVTISDMAAPVTMIPGVKTFTIEDPTYIEPAATGNAVPGDFVFQDVFIAQTYVQRPDAPYLKLVEDRWALIKVNATSASGALAPDFEAIVKDANGVELGRVRLTGAANLPTAVDLPSNTNLGTHSNADSYTAPLKGEWIKPGISITITAGGVPVNLPGTYDDTTPGKFTPDVGADANIDLRMLYLAMFERGDASYYTGLMNLGSEWLAKTPFGSLTVHEYPALQLDRIAIVNDQRFSEYYGLQTTLPGADNYAGYGAQWGLNSAAMNFAWLMNRANYGMTGGLSQLTYMGHLPNTGGGMGGGSGGGGDPYASVAFHELGHGMGRLHSHENSLYPYSPTSTGPNAITGIEGLSATSWVGPNWAYDQSSGTYISNYKVVGATTTLATDVMGFGSDPAAGFKPFSDYYNYLNFDFAEAQIDWQPNAVQGQDTEDGGFAGEGYFRVWSTATKSWTIMTDANFQSLRPGLVEVDLPHQRDVPVYWLSGYIVQPNGADPVPGGAYHPDNELLPIRTVGNLVYPLRDILTGEGRASSSGDYVARVTYATAAGLLTEHLILPSSYDLQYFGLNIADKGELVRVDIVEAPGSSPAVYLQNKVVGGYVNSEALANTVFRHDGLFKADDANLVLPKYWNGGKIAWSTTVPGLVNLDTGTVDKTKLGAGSAIRAQWVEEGVYKEQTFVLALPEEPVVYSQLFGTTSHDATFLAGDLALASSAFGGTVAWSSSNTAVLTNDGHKVGEGSATLTATVTFANGAVQTFSRAYQALPASMASGGLNLRIIDTSDDVHINGTEYTLSDLDALLATGVASSRAPLFSMTWADLVWWRGGSGFAEFGTAFQQNVYVNGATTNYNYNNPLKETLWTVSGFLQASETGIHSLRFKAVDAGRLYINVDGELVSLGVTNGTATSSNLDLQAGKQYAIWLFWKTSSDQIGTAAQQSYDDIELHWKTPSSPSTFIGIPAANLVPMPVDGSAAYPPGWLPLDSGASLTLTDTTLNGGELFTALTPEPATVLATPIAIETAITKALVSGTLFDETFQVDPALADPDMKYWVKLQLKDADGNISDSDPLEAWKVTVDGTTMTVTGQIDSTPYIDVMGIKVYADDNLVDSFSPALLTVHSNEKALEYMITGRTSHFETPVYGSDNADTIDASAFVKAAAIYGGDGNDVITGSAFDDVLFGGAGDDRLITKGGGDELVGGDGKDVFAFASGVLTNANSHRTLIDDFDVVQDRIDISEALGQLYTDLTTAGTVSTLKLVDAVDSGHNTLKLQSVNAGETITHMEIELKDNGLTSAQLDGVIDLGAGYRWDETGSKGVIAV